MRATGLRETPDEGIVVGFEEDDARRQNFTHLGEDGREPMEAAAFANVDDEGCVRDFGRFCDEIRESRNEFERKIVNGVEAEVFKCLKRRCLSSAGEASEDNQLTRG